MCEHGIVHLQTFAGTDFTDFRISLFVSLWFLL